MILRALSGLTLAAALLVPALASAATQVVYVTRHAEKAAVDKPAADMASVGTDPGLTAQGAARARMLGVLLQKTGIKAIYSTATKRTRQTAQPLAERLNVKVEEYDAAKPAVVVEKIKSAAVPTLLVGHSNTVPELVKLLGGGTVPAIADDEFDRLYQVSLHDNGTVSTVLLTTSAVSP